MLVNDNVFMRKQCTKLGGSDTRLLGLTVARRFLLLILPLLRLDASSETLQQKQNTR